MAAYVWLVVAVLSRVVPHPGLWNFTAVTGALLYFGARRPWREMLAPMAALMATDYLLTVFSYHYPFQWQMYVAQWVWYVAAMALGSILLRPRTSFARVAAGVVLGPTSFFLMSNFGVWATTEMYPHTFSGLVACYIAAIPFSFRNDLISTAIVCALAFGVPVLVRRMSRVRAVPTAS
jgi:hypothetical protein